MSLLYHMRHSHNYPCPKSKSDVLRIATVYGVPFRAEDVPFPIIMDPIPDLTTFDGFFCTSEGCDYACQKKRVMQQHIKLHENRGEFATSFPCIVQMPFLCNGRYRRVNQHSPTTTSIGVVHIEEELAILNQTFQVAVENDNVLRMTADPADTPPWLSRLHWPTLVHRMNTKVLSDLVSLPRDDETFLVGVRESIRDYFNRIGAIVQSDRYTTTLKHIHTSKTNM